MTGLPQGRGRPEGAPAGANLMPRERPQPCWAGSRLPEIWLARMFQRAMPPATTALFLQDKPFAPPAVSPNGALRAEASRDHARAGEAKRAVLHELAEGLTAAGNYLTGAQHVSAQNPGDMASLAAAIDQAADQLLRASDAVQRLRHLLTPADAAGAEP